MALDLSPLAGSTIAVTGHSGFKGTWLLGWLRHTGASVVGLSLPPDSDPTNVLASSGVEVPGSTVDGDIRDASWVREVFDRHQPDGVVHMAAQSLVRPSYEDPAGTFEINTLGTVNVLEAARRTPSVRAVLSVASDKCYRNPETGVPLKETDPLGGGDPYSASKAGAEVAAAAYAPLLRHAGALLATVRSGNVIGAGDRSRDRLVPDVITALEQSGSLTLRNPDAIRPWQHVLEPTRAYLSILALLMAGNEKATGPWNIGPSQDSAVTTRELTRMIALAWGGDLPITTPTDAGPAEATFLRLDASHADDVLGLHPVLTIVDAVRLTVDGYRRTSSGASLDEVIDSQLDRYLAAM